MGPFPKVKAKCFLLFPENMVSHTRFSLVVLQKPVVLYKFDNKSAFDLNKKIKKGLEAGRVKLAPKYGLSGELYVHGILSLNE